MRWSRARTPAASWRRRSRSGWKSSARPSSSGGWRPPLIDGTRHTAYDFSVSDPKRTHVAISEPRLGQRLLAMGGVALLHVLVYLAVTRATLLRPTSAFTDFRVGLDDKIPHLPWTWPAYWLPYVLVPIAAGVSTTRLGTRPFWRLILAWSGMIAIGGLIHLSWPAMAPWPMSPAATQRWYHDSALILPYATLPSMHVGHV